MICCPGCGSERWRLAFTIHGIRAASWWLRLASLGLIRCARVRLGYAGTCAKCGQRWCTADGQVWAVPQELGGVQPGSSAPKDGLLPREAERKASPPGGGLAFRTEDSFRR